MKLWVGKTIAVIAGVQAALGLIAFWGGWVAVIREGVWDGVRGHPDREAAFWMIAFGQFGMLLGFLADWAERTAGRLPGCFGWSVIGFVAITVALNPLTVLWLLVIPAVGAIVRAKRTKRARWTTVTHQTPR